MPSRQMQCSVPDHRVRRRLAVRVPGRKLARCLGWMKPGAESSAPHRAFAVHDPVAGGRTEKDPRTAGTSPYGLPNRPVRIMEVGSKHIGPVK